MMAERELAEQSEVFYYALITSRAVSVLAAFKRSGGLPPNGQDNLRHCFELMRQISRAQGLVQTRTDKIVPDLGSVQVYQHMLEATNLQEIRESGESIGQAADRFAEILEAVLAGKALSEIGEQEFSRLEKAIGALASVYASKTAISMLSKDPASLLQWPPLETGIPR